MNSVCVCIIGMCLARSMASTQRPCRVQTASQSHESMETLLFLSLSFGVISPAYYHRPFISVACHSVSDLFLLNFRYDFRTLALFFIYKCYLFRLLDWLAWVASAWCGHVNFVTVISMLTLDVDFDAIYSCLSPAVVRTWVLCDFSRNCFVLSW